MMIQSNYEINVSRLIKKPLDREPHYYHYCKIELGWARKEEAEAKLHELREFFPEDFKLQLMFVECFGKGVEEI